MRSPLLGGPGARTDTAGIARRDDTARPATAPEAYTAASWNARHPSGTKVVLTLANGKRKVTRTRSIAESWGGMDHVQVDAISQGYVPLAWVRPFLERPH